MRWENHTMTSIVFPVMGMNQSYADSNRRDFRKCQVIAVGSSGYPAVFDAEGFQSSLAENRRIIRLFFKMNAVFARYQSKIRHSGQIILPCIPDHTRVGSIQFRIIFIEREYFYLPFLIIYRKANHSLFLHRAFGHP